MAVANQMPLPHPANSRVAGHFANGFNLVGKKQGARATARRSRRGLAAGMAATHYHHIKAQIRARHAPPISALLPDAEVPEHDIENFLDTDPPCEAAKRE